MPSSSGFLLTALLDTPQGASPLEHAPSVHAPLVQDATELEMVKQQLILLLGIKQGELLCAPEFGHRLYQYAFMPNIEPVRQRLAQHITQIIQRCVPAAKAVEVSVVADAKQPTQVSLEIKFRLESERSAAKLTMQYGMQGERHAQLS